MVRAKSGAPRDLQGRLAGPIPRDGTHISPLKVAWFPAQKGVRWGGGEEKKKKRHNNDVKHTQVHPGKILHEKHSHPSNTTTHSHPRRKKSVLICKLEEMAEAGGADVDTIQSAN